MADEIRFSLNRVCVVLRPREPFLQWIWEADPYPHAEQERLSLADFQQDQDVFLLPGRLEDVPGGATKWVERRWRMFFEYMLNGWYTDESLWPSPRSLKMFREWVDIEVHSLVWDLAQSPLELEDWDADEGGV